ncbi:MAG: formate dehydrogenase accessory sulfurtransferase FdhD [Desulfatibacillum sp.]|nr:formate dehydrogenase accessory sulfurtransferase FdhD [Desulfatibacillum sp.]
MTDFKRTFSIQRIDPGQTQYEDLELIREMPLTISVEGIPMATAMRTPGFEEAQAAGLCLGDGILKTREDLVAFEGDMNQTSAHLNLKVREEARQRVEALATERRMEEPFPSGADDEAIASLLCSRISSFKETAPVIDRLKAHAHAQAIWSKQHIHRITRSAHATFIFDKDLNELSMAEDVGRHNALDKALGKVFLEGKMPLAEVVIVSCRMNKDVVRKCANAGISIVFSISRPTTLAVLMARQLNLTLALSTRDGGVYVFSGHDRLG